MNLAAEAACKVAKISCREINKPSKSRADKARACAELAARETANSACALARFIRDTTCFSGGDDGHRNAVDEAYKAMMTCNDKYAQWQCVSAANVASLPSPTLTSEENPE